MNHKGLERLRVVNGFELFDGHIRPLEGMKAFERSRQLTYSNSKLVIAAPATRLKPHAA
jgi:hypothetical protein